jgi:hypothetical protein
MTSAQVLPGALCQSVQLRRLRKGVPNRGCRVKVTHTPAPPAVPLTRLRSLSADAMDMDRPGAAGGGGEDDEEAAEGASEAAAVSHGLARMALGATLAAALPREMVAQVAAVRGCGATAQSHVPKARSGLSARSPGPGT